MRVTVHPPTGEDWEQPSAAEFLRLYDEGAFVPVPEVVELPDGRVVLDQSPAAERRLRRHNMWMRSLRVEVASQHVRTTARPRVRSREMSHAPRRAARSTPKAAQRSGDSGDDLPAPEAALAALFLLVYPFGGVDLMSAILRVRVANPLLVYMAGEARDIAAMLAAEDGRELDLALIDAMIQRAHAEWIPEVGE